MVSGALLEPLPLRGSGRYHNRGAGTEVSQRVGPRDPNGIQLQNLSQVEDELGLADMVFWNARNSALLHNPNHP